MDSGNFEVLYEKKTQDNWVAKQKQQQQRKTTRCLWGEGYEGMFPPPPISSDRKSIGIL